MKHKVCAISGTRADYGLLRRSLKRLELSDKIELHLIVTGSHLEDAFGKTKSEIQKDGFHDFISIPLELKDDTKRGMAIATGKAVTAFADCYETVRPELVLVLGDRYEVFAAAIAAHLSGISIAHISGGDVTEGAVDDAIRHSITKMSALHFPGCEQSRRRIIQMGEDPNRVFNVGEPGVENCIKTDFMSRDDLAESVGFEKIKGDYCLVTFHPVTMENDTGVDQVGELIRAMDSFPEMAYIITLANADAGGRAINSFWIEEGKKRDHWLVIPSLGVNRYLSAMKYARLVIGNSSSGIVETPSLGIPTINIGDRQKGRMTADNIISCEPKEKEIRQAMRAALQPEFRENAKRVESPFGKGDTSELIEKHMLDFLEDPARTNEKHFYDLDFRLD